MKNKFYVVIISIIAILLLVISFVFAINYKKGFENHFYDGGYILSNNYESGAENVNKLYFDAETLYKNKKDNEYTFKNSEGEKVNVSEESFVHYNNGSLMSLKKGVAIDLDDIDSKLISYYNIFEGSVLAKKNELYEIDNLNEKINFSKLMFKISSDKYLIASPKIVVSFSDNQTVEMMGYVEIEYVSENVIRIYNDNVNYQTIASNLYLIADNIKIDLEYKTISKNNKEYLTMADMVINSNDNIEVLPQPEKEEINKEENNQPDQGGVGNSQSGQNTNSENVGDSNTDSGNIQEGLDNLLENMPDGNEQIDTENEFIQPKFKVESMEVVTLGFENLSISFEDESSVLYGNRTVELLENSTGRVIQKFEDWEEGSKSYTINSYYSLKPNTEYTLNVVGQYKVDETVFDRTFVSKIFRTMDLGIEVMEDYVSSDSLSFAIYKSSYSDVSGFLYDILDSKGNIIVENMSADFANENNVVITETEKFKPNTEYVLIIKDIRYGNSTFLTVSYENLKVTYKTKTLKQNPFTQEKNDISLKSNVNKRENTVTLDISGINDVYGGIKNYTYNIYNRASELKQSISKSKSEPLTIDLESLSDEDAIFFNVEIDFDDNEKTIMFISQNSELIEISSIQYPKIVKFDKGKSENDSHTLVGNILIDDSGDFVEANKLSIYRVDIREKADSSMNGIQQYIYSIESQIEKTEKKFNLPVIFSDLTPNKEYLLYVYLKNENEDVYIGYTIAKTEPPEPIYLEFKNEKDTANLFNFQITKKQNSKSDNYVRKIQLLIEKYNASGILEESEVLRDIPKTQNNMDELYNVMGFDASREENAETNNKNPIFVRSSEEGFSLDESYKPTDKYKIKVLAYGSNYELDVIINGGNNIFEFELNDIEPQLDFNIEYIKKGDCKNNIRCKNFSNEFEGKNINDQTIVGFDYQKNVQVSSKGDEIDTIYYKIDKCTDNYTNLDKKSFIKAEFTEGAFFLPVGHSYNASDKLERGKEYCILYYGTYGENETDIEQKSFIAKKQGVKITGYISGHYEEKNNEFDQKERYVKFKLNINDPDNSLIEGQPIVLKQENSETPILPTIIDGAYIFRVSDLNYALKIIQQLDETQEIVEKTIYDVELDSIIELENYKVIVDTSNPGEVVLKFLCDPLYKDRIAGFYIKNEKQSFSAKFQNYNAEEEAFIYKMKSQSLKNYVDFHSGDNSQFKFNSIGLIYDTGKVIDYEDVNSNNAAFIKYKGNVMDLINKYYVNDKNQIFSSLANTNIFHGIPKNIEEKSILKINTFDSDVMEQSNKIGVSVPNNTTYRNVYFNKVGYTTAVTYNTQGQYQEFFDISKTVTTEKVDTIHTTTGAKIKFKLDTKPEDGTNFQITLWTGKQENNKFVVENEESIVMEYSEKNDKSITKGENTHLKGFDYTARNGEFEVIFENLNNQENYSHYYSIYYEETGKLLETYDNTRERLNDHIPINKLERLILKNKEAIYETKSWTWSDNDSNVMIEPIKKLKTNFIVDEESYNLKENEVIKYHIVATGIDGNKTNDFYLTDSLLDLKSENYYEFNLFELIGKLSDDYTTYDISIIPYVIENGEVSLTLEKTSLTNNKNLTISNSPPFFQTILIQKEGNFKITLKDNDAVLRACTESDVELDEANKTHKEGTIKSNDTLLSINSYYESVKNEKYPNVAYLEIFDNKTDEYVGFYPIPFADQTLNIPLNIEQGTYNTLIRYCMVGKKGTQQTNIDSIAFYPSVPLKKQILVAPNNYLLAFQGISRADLETKVKKIVYQVIDVNDRVYDPITLSNLDDDVDMTNNIDFTSFDFEDGYNVFVVALSVDGLPTSRIKSLEIDLYGLDESGKEKLVDSLTYPSE